MIGQQRKALLLLLQQFIVVIERLNSLQCSNNSIDPVYSTEYAQCLVICALGI